MTRKQEKLRKLWEKYLGKIDISQKELADILRWNQSQISRYISAERIPSMDTCVRMAFIHPFGARILEAIYPEEYRMIMVLTGSVDFVKKSMEKGVPPYWDGDRRFEKSDA